MLFIRPIADQESMKFPMPSLSKLRFFLVGLTLTSLVFSPVGCSYKPSYLQKSESTKVSERWRVLKLDPAKLTADEKAIHEKMGPPAYIRFFRNLSVGREPVYEWIYDEPVQLFTFINGKKVDYTVLDENPSSLNEAEREFLLWTGIVVGTIAIIGGAAYYFTAESD
jgi:hypothetical protein